MKGIKLILVLSCVAIITALFIVSCSDYRDVPKHASYIRMAYGIDKQTNLCFGFRVNSDYEIDHGTITCVPCDSLKKVNLFTLTHYTSGVDSISIK